MTGKINSGYLAKASPNNQFTYFSVLIGRKYGNKNMTNSKYFLLMLSILTVLTACGHKGNLYLIESRVLIG